MKRLGICFLCVALSSCSRGPKSVNGSLTASANSDAATINLDGRQIVTVRQSANLYHIDIERDGFPVFQMTFDKAEKFPDQVIRVIEKEGKLHAVAYD